MTAITSLTRFALRIAVRLRPGGCRGGHRCLGSAGDAAGLAIFSIATTGERGDSNPQSV
jgi:hypothetical protein